VPVLFGGNLHLCDDLARDIVAAPPNGGPSETVYAPDNLPPAGSSAGLPAQLPADLLDRLEGSVSRGSLNGIGAGLRTDEIGGDDVLILEDGDARNVAMDIDAAGNIYVAIEVGLTRIDIYRSVDDGSTFGVWGSIFAGGTDIIMHPCIDVVEGSVSECFIAFTRVLPGSVSDIRLVHAPEKGSSVVS